MSNVKIARKKPIEIEVIQITGDNKKIEEINDFCGQYTFKRISPVSFSIETLEGDMLCHCFDWIAKGVEGEMYPITKSVFKASHTVIS